MRWADPKYLRTHEYRTEDHLKTRLEIYRQVSTGHPPWHRWLFEQMSVAPGSRIVDVGCGYGQLWHANNDRTPGDWQIVAGDLSLGMLDGLLRSSGARTRFVGVLAFDAANLPFSRSSFDVAIAHNVLYHVADLSGACAGLARVLASEGRLYAATIGAGHLEELREMLSLANAAATDLVPDTFQLSAGAKELRRHFNEVDVIRYPSELVFQDVGTLERFVLTTNAREHLRGERLDVFRDILRRRTPWPLRIATEVGLLSARHPLNLS